MARWVQDVASQVDDVARALSPRWAAQREVWRKRYETLTSYRSSYRRRVDPAKQTGGSADYHLEFGYDRREMVDRARELDRNNGLGEALLNRCVENVGPITIRSATANERWNRQAEAMFRDWCEDGCDARGLDNFEELQALTLRSYLRDGDILAYKRKEEGIEGTLQHFEADELANPLDKTFSDPRFVDGVELDALGRPVRFHVVWNPNLDKIQSTRQYIPGRRELSAADCLFLARRHRHKQTRGESVLAKNAWLIEQIDKTVEAVVFAARMAACFGLVVETSNDGFPGGLPSATGSNGDAYKDWRLEPAMFKQLSPGEKVTQVKPEHPGTNFEQFIRLLSRLVGIPWGLPLELVMLDFSQTNYSSARASLLQAYQSFRKLQRMMARRYVMPIYKWKVMEWIAEGYLAPRADAMRCTYKAQGWRWVDPMKEALGRILAIDAGFATLGETLAEMGKDLEETIEARASELEMLKKAGVPIIRSSSVVEVEEDPEPDSDQAEEPESLNMRAIRRLSVAVRKDPGLIERLTAGERPSWASVADVQAVIKRAS